MPCHKGGPVEAYWTYVYRWSDRSAFGFSDAELLQFMGSVKGVRKQHLLFDLTSMSCPFEFRLQYLQPHAPNRVGEVGSQDAARRPLIDWLARAELDLSEPMLDSVYGDSLTIAVPCVKIDIKPTQE